MINHVNLVAVVNVDKYIVRNIKFTRSIAAAAP